MNKALRLASDLDPVFCIHSSKLKVLKSPKDFYESIIDGIFRSKRQILLTSLYFGNGIKEKIVVQ